VGGHRKFLACRLQIEDADKSASEVTVAKYFMLSPRTMLGQAIMLHNEFPISPTWRANCHGVRPGQIRKGATQVVVG
jgi:hypothetical protein